MAILIVLLIIVLAITFGNAGILCMMRRARYRFNHCEGNADPDLDLGFTLDGWISETPVIRDAIIWRPDGDTALAYPSWSGEDKELLRTLYERLKSDAHVDLAVEPPILEFAYFDEGRGDRGNLVIAVAYDVATAKTTFFAHVAQSLCVEIERRVSWSMLDLSSDNLAYLLDSRHMYTWSPSMGAHTLQQSHGKATPGDPGRVFRFLQDEGIIRGSERDTIVAMLEWCRGMTHDVADLAPDGVTITLWSGSRDGNETHWQYEGYQPVERTIQGTVRAGWGNRHWTHGCQGTTGFLRCLLRTINVPVGRADGCEHAIPHFLNDRTFISHGDDPYTEVMRTWTPRIPMTEILLGDERLPGFFDPCEHVGRGVKEAIARLLPDQLIEMHCEDLRSGASRPDGQVMAYLRVHNLDDAYLARERFWERLQEELDRRGGCDGLI